VCSRRGAIQIHVYLYLTLPVTPVDLYLFLSEVNGQLQSSKFSGRSTRLVVEAVVADVQYSIELGVATHLVQQTHNVVAQLGGQRRVLRLRKYRAPEPK